MKVQVVREMVADIQTVNGIANVVVGTKPMWVVLYNGEAATSMLTFETAKAIAKHIAVNGYHSYTRDCCASCYVIAGYEDRE